MQIVAETAIGQHALILRDAEGERGAIPGAWTPLGVPLSRAVRVGLFGVIQDPQTPHVIASVLVRPPTLIRPIGEATPETVTFLLVLAALAEDLAIERLDPLPRLRVGGVRER